MAPAPKGTMILAFGILASALGTVGLLSFHLSKAPVGFEGRDGFHFAESDAAPAIKAPARTHDLIVLGTPLASRR